MLAVTGVLALAVDDYRVKIEKTRAAEANRLALEIVDELYGQVSAEELVSLPGMELLRLKVAEKAWQYSLLFLRMNPNDIEVWRKVARISREVANVRRMYGEFKEAEVPSAESVRHGGRHSRSAPAAH